jgi:hypothetical protein
MSLLTTLITSDIRMQLRLTKFVSIVMKIVFFMSYHLQQNPSNKYQRDHYYYAY